jgi:hypothetical protein
MEKIIDRQIPAMKCEFLFRSTYSHLIRGDSEKLTWPNNPLLEALRHGRAPNLFIAPEGGQRDTALYILARNSQ